ncbi:MAG: hypothetical protein AAB834_06715, partial [Patescibacteria group bacterium]
MDTLIHDPWREALEAATGLPHHEIGRRQDVRLWEGLEMSMIDESAYWQGLLEHGVKADPRKFHLARLQGYHWLPGAKELLQDLVAANHTVVLASNYPVWIEDLKP